MSNISPKLIDVEKNRVGTDGGTMKVDLVYHKQIGVYGEQTGFNHKCKVGKLDGGRFPTQLFTNIKNDRYKYVKRINI